MLGMVLLAGHAFAAEATRVDLTAKAEYLEDRQGTLSLADVEGPAASRFAPMKDGNLGYSRSTFWFRIPLAEEHGDVANRLLEVAFFDLNHVAFYAPDRPPVVAGQDYPINAKVWPHRFYVFPLTLTGEPRYYYLQVRSDNSVTVPLTLWEPAAFADETQKIYLAQALYFGELLALLIYNLLIFLSLRERVFLLYSLFVSCMGLAMLTGNGLARQFLWPEAWSWPSGLTVTPAGLAVFFALLFARHFLQTRTLLPRLHHLIQLAAGFAWTVAAAPWINVMASFAASGLSVATIVTGGLMIAAGFLSWRAGNRNARLFLLAWGVLALGGVVAGMHSFGLLPTNILTAYAIQLSSAAEMLLLSFALAERIRLERDARAEAQSDALSARQSLVETLRESEAWLEKTIAERTSELNQALKNERSLLDRYLRFGALISHEFRNPLAIIKSQLMLIEKERRRGLDNIERRLGTVSAATSRLGVLFEEWLQSDRMRQPTQELSMVNIPLATWLVGVIDDCRKCYLNYPFELRIADGLPDINADEAMLRIAVHNLVDNAAKYAPPGTKIGVEALERDGMVGIAVIDSGPGIAPKHRDAIFADYFRIAPKGEVAGLGLGLAFVKKIVDLHCGWIELKSELGVGTGFCLWLPGNTDKDTSQ